MKKILFILMVAIMFMECKKNDEKKTEQEKEYTTIVGYTYIANHYVYSFIEDKVRHIFLIYTFDQNGAITIEERYDSETGELIELKKGRFEYNHPVLKLEIQSICEDCFNYFTANVSEDKKEFSYEIFTNLSKKEILVFKVK
jgi:hypothetical protein